MHQKVYERHRREYTLLGMTAVITNEFFSQSFIDFFGTTCVDMPVVIKDGAYYHFELEGDRQRVAGSFLEKVNRGELDLEQEYLSFDRSVSEYEKFIGKPAETYALETIVRFYDLYLKILPVAYASMDTLDVIEVLDESKRAWFSDWALRVRQRAEFVYKRGETEFIPAFAEWLAKNHFHEYTGKQMQYVLSTEMMAFLQSKKALPSPSELDARYTFCYINQWPVENIELYTGEKAEQAMRAKGLVVVEENTQIKELKGQTAFPGTVTGRVRLIHSRQDMAGFQDGEIIVASMTDPNYLPIMKRAAAFVTDEGGTLCHAAIVARELKKPCVIGTKIATDFLRNGDMILVNADKGLITKV